MRRRRSVEVFSLSFLDCICCGFGAIILLLVLTEIGRPVVLEKSRKNLDGQIRALNEKLHTLRGETDELTRRCVLDPARDLGIGSRHLPETQSTAYDQFKELKDRALAPVL